MAGDDDEAIARELQAQEMGQGQQEVRTSTAGQQQIMRHPLLRQKDVLMVELEHLNGKRAMLIALACLDIIALVVLLLQLTPGGFPRDGDDFEEAFSQRMVEDAWFIPLVISLIFPLLCIVATVMLWQWALWVYCGYLVVMIGVRCYFLFEAGKREGIDERDVLLLDMILLSLCIFLQVYTIQATSTLLLLVRRVRMQERFLRGIYSDELPADASRRPTTNTSRD